MTPDAITRSLSQLGEKLRSALASDGSDRDPIVVVSGLPRSGTSMMMQMLDRGGVPPLTDHEREPDEDNPKGYYEFERVKKLEDGDTAWVPQARGHAVKVISALLRKLPEDETYRVVFMKRKLEETLASQRKMLERRGEDPDDVSDEELKALFEKHLTHIQAWARDQDDVELLEVSYNRIMDDPQREVERVASFLGGDLDVEAMVGVVDPDLYRQRK